MEEETVGEAATSPEDVPSGNAMSREISATVAKLGAGEKFAVLGAAGIMGVWLVFDLLIDEYFIGQLPFALALSVVLAAYLHHSKGSGEWAIPYKTIVVAGAGMLGILGSWFIIEELRNGIFDTDATTALGAIIFYAGSIVSGVGAWQLSKQ